MVAGVLANFLAYDTIPFVITNKNLPTEAKKFLKTKASWNRIPDVSAIWNRVTEADNPKKAGAATIDQSTTQAATTVLSTTQVPPSTPTPIAPYAQGTCHIHVYQWNRDGEGKYDLDVLMTDNDGNEIGYTQPRGGADGYTASDPLQLQSKLEDVLTCIPEKENDYIQFSLGQQAWPSNGDFVPGAIPSCSVGGWDGRENPSQYLVRDNRKEHLFHWLTKNLATPNGLFICLYLGRWKIF